VSGTFLSLTMLPGAGWAISSSRTYRPISKVLPNPPLLRGAASCSLCLYFQFIRVRSIPLTVRKPCTNQRNPLHYATMDGFHDVSQFLANASKAFQVRHIHLWQVPGAGPVDCGICIGQVEVVRHLLAHRVDSHTQGWEEANSVSLGIAKRTPRSGSAPSNPLRRCK
jgi:hypothetical protein